MGSACGEGIHQTLVIGVDVELAAFHKISEVPDKVHGEEFTIKGAVRTSSQPILGPWRNAMGCQ